MTQEERREPEVKISSVRFSLNGHEMHLDWSGAANKRLAHV